MIQPPWVWKSESPPPVALDNGLASTNKIQLPVEVGFYPIVHVLVYPLGAISTNCGTIATLFISSSGSLTTEGVGCGVAVKLE